MTPYADLHCHTLYSDGTDTPAEIVEKAVQKGFKGLSVTDHDTVAAYPELIAESRKQGLKLISGVEFSCTHKNESIHVLGYGFDLNSPLILNLIDGHKKRREGRNKEILTKLRYNRMPLDPEALESLNVTGRPHIAKAMVKMGYVKDIPEAFKKWIGDGKPCFAPSESYTIEETIDIIHKAGGVAILAHPHLIEKNRTFNEVARKPFDGLECHYGNFPLAKCQKFLKICSEKNWLATGGSDYHGQTKPHQRYGSSFVTESLFYELLGKTASPL
jgi:predicted metal-dependent phosphoesterase TrpH